MNSSAQKFQKRARLLLGRLTGEVKAPQTTMIVSEAIDPPRNLLFIFPQNRERFVESRYVLRRLEKHRLQGGIELVIPDIYKKQIPEPSHQTFFYPVDSEKPDKLPYEVLHARLSSRRYDSLICLDPNLTADMARLVSAVSANVVMGFKVEGADAVFNVQIVSDLDGFLEGGYEKMLLLCGLGRNAQAAPQELWA